METDRTVGVHHKTLVDTGVVTSFVTWLCLAIVGSAIADQSFSALKAVPGSKTKRYDKSTVDEVCRWPGEGESLLKVSKDHAMPSRRTLSDWVANNHVLESSPWGGQLNLHSEYVS